MPYPRVDVVVLTLNDRPAEEAAAQATLLAQRGVDVRVVVVGNGCRPEVVPPGALTVCLPENVGIPAGRNAGADALGREPDPAQWLFFLDNDAAFPRIDVLARLITEAQQHPRAAYVQPRLTGPDDVTTPRRWVPRLRASRPERPGTTTTMTEGVVLVRREAFDAVGGWPAEFFLYHEGLQLAWQCWSAGWTGWYAAGIRMHHPLTSPTRHALFHRLAARNRIWVAYRSLPAPLIPFYLAVWAAITVARAVRVGGLREALAGTREGWTTRRALGSVVKCHAHISSEARVTAAS
ncbi:glycosyl transferase [Streptomyces litmocidini]|uniref:glycosyltransferase family 2 protein n=1 Tax=Streptomyces litmocidini TaxID=67318 RepID=UPI00167ECC53|nr:glycosyltransferase [Streptomyces litmocidini]GGV08116.1 glycosyl transferase [Streptomyces litmocidini]